MLLWTDGEEEEELERGWEGQRGGGGARGGRGEGSGKGASIGAFPAITLLEHGLIHSGPQVSYI